MRYTHVHIQSIGYELAPVVVNSEEIEERLDAVYSALHLPNGQLESLTGIAERRWWDEGYSVARGASEAGRKAMAMASMDVKELGALIYTGVNREAFEPATACHVAAELDVGGDAVIYDISNACLGMLNGMVDIANRIELGQIRAGLVVACETAREINEVMIARMNAQPEMDFFMKSLATLTGGSGAAAILLTDGSFGGDARPALLGGTSVSAPEHFDLCTWGLAPGSKGSVAPYMSTDAPSVLKFGVALGERTWDKFRDELGWSSADIDKVICHQVGNANRETILKTIGIPEARDFSSYPYLGNMGTVSLPITAALAEERGFLRRGDRVGFLGIGSGLNCIMLGLQW